ncbi:MAG: ferrous iron transport protein B [Bacteroidales bacterium]|nr:ferrous iron transport protein B [Bacteroidales bacterium]MCF8336503.1 ferrous iron transport protein B [Bacteroidales bacterium]
MTLYDLDQGERGVITKVKGHGSFRKRITEMGFVIGKEVKVIKKAPLRDPVEYKIMDYFVTLRNSEAKLVEVVSEKEVVREQPSFNGTIDSQILKRAAYKKEKTVNIALVGNPNSGKTTIFNYIAGMTEKVGNYGGVTVDVKKANFHLDGYDFNIIDLPGTYSITAYSPEELFVREYILEEQPDIVINMVDSGNLERNLYLTTQLIDMDIKVVVALNMYDEFRKNGDELNYEKLGQMLGIPFIPTVGNRKVGINTLFRKGIDVFEDREDKVRHIHVNYGKVLEKGIREVEKAIKQSGELNIHKISPRFLAIKLLENDEDALEKVRSLSDSNEILEIKDEEVKEIERMLLDDCENLITDAKYAFISGALHETMAQSKIKRIRKSEIIDTFITHKLWGIPIFAFFMWLTFFATFKLGEYPMEWIEGGIGLLSTELSQHMQDGILKDLLVNGILGGVGGVLVFLPNIIILYFFISLMEDTGYMARAVFIMDRLMHKIGLHGKSFIPLLMGFGCNVPAIMATRTIESKRDRMVTMLITPFMSCSARLPVFILLISAFFQSYQATILFALYLLGVLIAIGSSMLLTKSFFKKAEQPFVMELPPYRLPTFRSLVKHMWSSAQQYLRKIAGVILLASIIIWALGYFPVNVDYSKDYKNEIAYLERNKDYLLESGQQKAGSYSMELIEKRISKLKRQRRAEKQQKSYIGKIGNFVQPVMEPLGFDWKMTVGIITGVAAKEVVVGTLGVLYQADPEKAEQGSGDLVQKLQMQQHQEGPREGKSVFTPLVALSFMIFVLIYFPCVAVIAAIKKESGSWKWALFEIFYTTSVAWIVAFLVYQTGSLII